MRQVSANDSTRALHLARTPCGGGQGKFVLGKHSLEEVGEDAFECKWCGLRCTKVQSKVQQNRGCPVPQKDHLGDSLVALNTDLRLQLVHFHLFREWCTVAETTGDENPGDQEGAPELQAPEAPLGVRQAEPSQEDPPSAVPSGTGRAARWGSLRPCYTHRPVDLAGVPWCLRCGRHARRKEQAAHWAKSVCAGDTDLRQWRTAELNAFADRCEPETQAKWPDSWRARYAAIAAELQRRQRPTALGWGAGA